MVLVRYLRLELGLLLALHLVTCVVISGHVTKLAGTSFDLP